jgi:uncharacterized membrane protein YuzA (DUF378 family)
MRSNRYDWLTRTGLALAVFGAVNWLLVGLFEWNFVQWIFTSSATQEVSSVGARLVYVVIGAGGIVAIPMLAATFGRSRRRTSYQAGDEDEETAERLQRARSRVAPNGAGVIGADEDRRAPEPVMGPFLIWSAQEGTATGRVKAAPSGGAEVTPITRRTAPTIKAMTSRHNATLRVLPPSPGTSRHRPA